MLPSIAAIACDPPLGSVTTVDTSSVVFNVAINTSYHPGSDFSVRLWHESTEGWTDLNLDQIPTPLDEAPEHFATFQGLLENREQAPGQVRFTLKIIVDELTTWVNDIETLPDGIVVFQAKSYPLNLDNYLESIDQSWRVQQVQSEAYADSNLWLCQSNIPGSSASDSSWDTLHLGQAVNSLKWFALVRHSTPWLGPRQGNSKFYLDKPGVLASFLQDDGSHLLVLPVNGIPGILTTLESDDAGNIIVKSRNDKLEQGAVQVIITVSKSFEMALSTAISQLHSQLPNYATDGAGELSDWYDGFSYCTWNGLGRELNVQRILDALGGLTEQGIQITNLIIDDNWQSLDEGGSTNPFEYKWTDFQANKENFPQGLRHLTEQVRQYQPYIKHIAVWHGIFGYWGGVSHNGHIAKCYETKEVQRQTQESYMSGGTITVVAASEVNRMYDDFYAFLAESGIDSVKADNQYYPDYVEGAADRKALIYSYQDAWLAAATKHFSHRAISCMSQTPQILFHSFFNQDNQPPYLVRNSDDFFPDEPSSHTWHLFCNAHNAVLTQHFNLLPDWDMFQTVGAFPDMHAAARCLSGGPIYITDVPGQHDVNLIKQMTATAVGGRLKILRPDTIGRASEVYNAPTSHLFLRINSAHKGSSSLGIFNIGDRERMELVTSAAFPTLDKGTGAYLVKSHVANKVQVIPDWKAAMSVVLKPKEYEILTAYRIESQADFKFAVLGLAGKMTGIAAMSDKPATSVMENGTLLIRVSLKALGTLSLWLDRADEYLAENLVNISLPDEEKNPVLNITSSSANVLEVKLDLSHFPGSEDVDAPHRLFTVEIRVTPL
ncbi:Nn.00g069910.m01.CDS01 [Neocucurbitaria sp. VM-36]